MATDEEDQMSRRNRFTPKNGQCTRELIDKATGVWNSWNEVRKKNGTLGTPIPKSYLYSDRVPANSLLTTICGWIENNEDWQEQWNAVLERLGVRSHFLNGYKDFVPTLYWMFSVRGDMLNLEQVLEGRYDFNVHVHPDEGMI
jgi:hypothetical protein